MEPRALLRIAAVAAIIGGVLRAATTFMVPPTFGAAVLPATWLANDAFLLLGIAGIYLAQADRLGVAGLTGTLVFLLGILLVRSANIVPGGYVVGATVALVGVALLGLVMLLRGTERIAPVLWLAALAAGIASAAGHAASLIALSGILFGLGFAAAGAKLLRA
jgi:hypothetical protein